MTESNYTSPLQSYCLMLEYWGGALDQVIIYWLTNIGVGGTIATPSVSNSLTPHALALTMQTRLASHL